MSLPFARGGRTAVLAMAVACAAAARADEPDRSWSLPQGAPALGALGIALSVRPPYTGADSHRVSATPNFLVRWGRLSLSNGGTLASRSGESVEGGLAADLYSRERLRLSASLRWDAGRRSGEDERMRGVHDIPSHLRARLQGGWRLHPQWDLSASWRPDLSGRGTGSSLELTLLHEWRPDFLDRRLWKVSAGISAEALDARRANLIFGITADDARRSRHAAFTLDGGLSQLRGFVNWRRELTDSWVAYGSFTLEGLVGQAAQSPLTARNLGVSVSAGLGRRF